MIVGLGLLLLGFFALVFLACLRVLEVGRSPHARAWAIYGALAVALILLLFRPEEEMEAGEDAGAYFHAAMSYARHGTLRFPDPGLATVPASERPLFRYGHAGFGITKDAVLWANDETMDEVGPHFFPGYSLLLAVPIALGYPYAAFGVSSLLAVMIGCLLAMLARGLTGRPLFGWLAFALYILNPVIVWNARCLRAEWPASFLALAGIYLWIGPSAMAGSASYRRAFLAGLALTGALLFHITAAYVLIPALIVALWNTERTRFWAGWWGGASVGVALFVAQLTWITDPYWIWSNLVAPERRAMWSVVGMTAILGIVGAHVIRTRYRARIHMDPTRMARLAGALTGVLFIGVVIYALGFRTAHGRIPGLPEWTAAYISLTDFGGVHRLFSRFWFFAALLGLPVLGARAGPSGRAGRFLLLLLAPAGMTIGWANNYMFETRRMVTFLTPLLIISTISLFAAIGSACFRFLAGQDPKTKGAMRARHAVVPVLLALACLMAAVRGRSQLYTVWNYRGAHSFYRDVAAHARQTGDFLFAEYTQTSVPVERLSGLPLLPIAWGYRSEAEYRGAERVFQRLVEEHPARRHLFITPFQGVALPGVALTPLFEQSWDSQRLDRARRSVPSRIRPIHRTLRVYRVWPAAANAAPATYTRIFDGSQLGLHGRANFMPGRSLSMRGWALEADAIYEVSLPPLEPTAIQRIFLVFHVPRAETPPPLSFVGFDNSSSHLSMYRPTPRWLMAELCPEQAAGSGIQIKAHVTLHLADVWTLASDGVGTVRLGGNTVLVDSSGKPIPLDTFSCEGADSQWMRAEFAMGLPRGTEDRLLWMLTSSGRRDGVVSQGRVRVADSGISRDFTLAEEGWHWQLIPLPGTHQAESAFAWHQFEIVPAWNPETRGFPEDLGVRIQLVYTRPHKRCYRLGGAVTNTK